MDPQGELLPGWGFASWPFTGAHSNHWFACTELSTQPCEGTLGPCSVSRCAEELCRISGGGAEGPEGCRKDRWRAVDLTRDPPPHTLLSTLDPWNQALWFPTGTERAVRLARYPTAHTLRQSEAAHTPSVKQDTHPQPQCQVQPSWEGSIS